MLLAIISLAVGIGYFFYQQANSGKSITSSSILTPKLNISTAPLDIASFKQVLGNATSAVLDTSNSIANQIAGEEGGPVINEAIETIQQEISEIPQEQYDKLKYEFCQGVIDEYEEDNND